MRFNYFLKAYDVFPRRLFRVNNGPKIRLRAIEGPERPMNKSFDILTKDGMALAKAKDPPTYEWPNGASLRPNSKTMYELLLKFRGANIIVYEIPQGTAIPKGLILVHEFDDHWSLQAGEDMQMKELNTKLSEFLGAHGIVRTREEWFKEYPAPTE